MSCFGSRNRLTLVYRLDRKQRAETMTRAGFAAVRGSAVSSNVAEFRTGKSALSDAHVLGMATIVQCNCGAEYRRTEEKFLVPHTGDARSARPAELLSNRGWKAPTFPNTNSSNVLESRNDTSPVRLIWFRQKANIESSGASQDQGAHFVITARSRGSYR